MKKLRFVFCFVALIGVALIPLSAQKNYAYKTYPNDNLGVREYTLDNGLKVFMSVYKDKPTVQTYIAVRAGSKNDPHETTGLAHYLEHMMFKGTQKLGTTDWAKEKVIIQQIEDLFETYRMFDDPAIRAAIYHKIDSLRNDDPALGSKGPHPLNQKLIVGTATRHQEGLYTICVQHVGNSQRLVFDDRSKHVFHRHIGIHQRQEVGHKPFLSQRLRRRSPIKVQCLHLVQHSPYYPSRTSQVPILVVKHTGSS